MRKGLPPEIVVTEAADGFRYCLPRPDFGQARFVGCFLIPFGLLPAVAGAFFISFAARVIPDLTWPAILISCVFLLIPLAFLVGGLSLIYLGAWMLVGEQEITLTARHVGSAWRVGPLRWPGRRSRARLRQFTVVRGNQAGPVARGTPEANGMVLLAECEGGRPLRLAVGYPEEWLQALAADLARKCRTLPAGESAEPVGVAEESASPHDIRDRPERPVNCRAVLEERPGGVSLVMPPAGVWHGTNKFIVFWTFAWCAFVLIFSAAFGTAALQGKVHNQQGDPDSPLCSILFLVPFWLVGIGFLIGVLHRGQRRVRLTVDGDRLLVVQSGLSGTRRREWSRGEIVGLRVVCDRRSTIGEGKRNPYYPWQIDLRIVPRDGPAVNALTYREGDPRKADLEWMATLLRGALRLQEE
jgi:hypothetical protein